MYDNNRNLGLGNKEMFEVKKCFICKTPSLNEFWITFSHRLKNYMPKICQNFRRSCNVTFLNEVTHWSLLIM